MIFKFNKIQNNPLNILMNIHAFIRIKLMSIVGKNLKWPIYKESVSQNHNVESNFKVW